MEIKQLQLFDEIGCNLLKPIKRVGGGGNSQNPIVFNDYESFVAKFTDKPKTTDDCYTPQDVYDCVVRYVGTLVDLSDKVILRPFYPGGDYENAEYPDNGIVIDNPPFSIFTKICRFYSAHKVPFFLFGNGMTIASVAQIATIVVVGRNMQFSNGADVNVNFATNLTPDIAVMTAPELQEQIEMCESQNQKADLPTYELPPEILRITDLQTISGGGVEFVVKRSECEVVRDLDCHPKGLFGNGWITATAKATAKATATAKAKAVIKIHLSPREKRIVARLDESLQKNL